MHLWTTQVTLIKQRVSSIKCFLFPWRPWYLLCGWMDGYGGISSLNVGHCVCVCDAFPSWHLLAVWSDEYCSIGSTRPAQHDTTTASPLDWWKSVLAKVAPSTPCPVSGLQPCAVCAPECTDAACRLLLYLFFFTSSLSLVTLWWPLLICAVFAHQTESVCFPSLL